MEKLSNCLQSTCLDIPPEPGLNQPSIQRDLSTVQPIQAPNDFALCVQYKFSGTNSVPNDRYSLSVSSGCTFLYATPKIGEITVIYEGYNDLCHQVEPSLKSNIYITPNYTEIVGTVGVIYNVWLQKRGTKILSPTLTQQENPTTPPLPDKIYLYKEGDECTDITGGWEFGNGSITGKPIASNSNGKITITGNPNGQYGFLTITTINEIDTPNNYRLCIEYDMDISEGEEYVGNQTMRAYSQYSEIKFYDLKTNRVIVKDNTKLENYICERKNYKTSASVVYIDFSSIGFNSNHIVHIYNIWLEKDSSIELFE